MQQATFRFEEFANLLLLQNEKNEILLARVSDRLEVIGRSIRQLFRITQEQKTMFMRGMKACQEGYQQTLKAAELNIESSEEIRDSMATATISEWR